MRLFRRLAVALVLIAVPLTATAAVDEGCPCCAHCTDCANCPCCQR